MCLFNKDKLPPVYDGFNDDFKACLDLVGEVKQSCALDGRLDVYFRSPFYQSIGAAREDLYGQALYLNPLVFVDPSKFSGELRIDCPDDPRLDDPQFVQKFGDYINKCLESRDLGLDNTPQNMYSSAVIRMFLRARKDSVKYQKMIQSLLGHELGHLHYEHTRKLPEGEVSTNSSLSSRVVFTAKKQFVEVKTFLDKKLCFKSRRHEREADLFMIEKLGKEGLEGSAYGFDLAKRSFLEIRSSGKGSYFSRLLRKILISPSGNFLPFTFTHRSFDARYVAMEKHLAAGSSSAL